MRGIDEIGQILQKLENIDREYNKPKCNNYFKKISRWIRKCLLRA